jgi:tetratricopeptide (TPR) repeat protein
MKKYLNVLAIIVFCLIVTSLDAHAGGRTLRGAVVTSDGTMVPDFTVVAKPLTEKPELVQRRRFKNGMFALDGLGRQKYQVIVTAPQFIGVRMDVDLPKNGDSTVFRIVVLHRIRNERYFPGSPIHTVSARLLAEPPEQARQSYQAGVEYHREGQLEKALENYGRALRKFPKYFQALTDTGTIYLLLNRPDAALIFLKRAQELEPNSPIVKINIAAGQILKKKYDDAIKILNSVLADVPDKSLPHLMLARAFYFQKKFEKAEQLAHSALEEDPKLLDAWLLLVNMALDQKQYGSARESLIRMRETMGNRLFSAFVNDQIDSFGDGAM